MSEILDLFLHLDKHLAALVQSYGTATYLILGLILFCETGLVITPFLPGDSLLFAAGAIASTGALDPFLLMAILITGALCGDMVNYHVGKFLGPRAFDKRFERVLKPKYLERTQRFYARHGGKTIIMARFVPIIRTFVPFMAGVGQMSFIRYASFSIFAAILWVTLFVGGGYLFGEIPIVKRNFSLVVIAIILVSLMPIAIEYLRAKKEARTALA